ncbi:MAG: hypothetical protein CW716_07490 [Candidatus Bathyarchaeum sp.]|nr:MAG: hypothetical protein CW716_07490 [Candidatus Bathyarchaeum sp.]
MVSVTIEYVILVPLLFTQVIVFPLVASTMTNSWQDSQRDVALQEIANHVASTIQQLYLTVNMDEILGGDITHVLDLPVTVSSYPYTATCSLSTPSEPGAAKVLTVTLILDDVDNTVNAVAVLGPNVAWTESSFRSVSSTNTLEVNKADGTLTFSFGG